MTTYVEFIAAATKPVAEAAVFAKNGEPGSLVDHPKDLKSYITTLARARMLARNPLAYRLHTVHRFAQQLTTEHHNADV